MNHADPIDEAAEREQQMIEVALANRPKSTIEFTGMCHFCQETITKWHYCDAECRHDHEKELWAAKNRRSA